MVIQVKDMEFEKAVKLFKRKSGVKINMNAFKRFVRVNRIKYTQESVLKFLSSLKPVSIKKEIRI